MSWDDIGSWHTHHTLIMYTCNHNIVSRTILRWPIDAIPYSISHFQIPLSTSIFCLIFSQKSTLYRSRSSTKRWPREATPSLFENKHEMLYRRWPREATPSFRKLIISTKCNVECNDSRPGIIAVMRHAADHTLLNVKPKSVPINGFIISPHFFRPLTQNYEPHYSQLRMSNFVVHIIRIYIYVLSSQSCCHGAYSWPKLYH